MASNLEKIIKFTKFLNEFKSVKRTIYATGEDRFENDAEHSYQLTMLAWYFIEIYQLQLDKELIIKYCLIHDLVEVYAGDVYFYTSNTEELENKELREQEAARKIESNYPEFDELHDLIKDYEKREDEESKFVYALDKIVPVINTYIDGGRTRKEYEISLDILIELKKQKIAVCKNIEPIREEFIKKIKKEQKQLFKENL